ncbi:SMI1 / KNR4 family protein [compost metagenome]
MNTIKEVIIELHKFDNDLIEFNPPVDPQLIVEFEKRYMVQLPDDYKQLIHLMNGFSLMGTGVLGLDSGNKVHSLENIYEIEHHEVDNPQPRHLVPFCNDGRGNFYCFDTAQIDSDGNSKIVFWQSDIDYSLIDPEVVNNDLIEWIKEVVIDWTLEDYNYDGTEK